METAEFAKLIKTRRSIHTFQDKPVPEEQLVQAIELAIWAPNAGNQQNWRFYVILKKETINAIVDAMQSVQRTIMSWPEMSQAMPRPGAPPDGAPPGGPPGGAQPGPGGPPAGGAPRGGPGADRSEALRKSPALIAIASRQSINQMDEVIAEKAKTDPKAKQIIDAVNIANPNIQSVSAAIAFLTLALHQLGLGSVWMASPSQSAVEIQKILNMPADLNLVAMLVVGYAAESPTRDRKPVSEVMEIIK